MQEQNAQRSKFPKFSDIPGGPVALSSPFYLSRPVLEAVALSEIAKPGGLLRLKAPQKMGKSTLMLRLIQQAASLDYRPVYLDLQLADHLVLAEPGRFLRWFCAAVSRGLGLDPKLDQYWDSEVSSNMNCSLYLQNYLLRQDEQQGKQQDERPILLLINEVNRIFDYAAVASVFLPLVRSLYEAARSNRLLQNLRLVLAYSTEIYVPLNLNQSPFNVGLLLELPGFTDLEIQTLAMCYGFSWNLAEAMALQQFVGGHPYLVQMTLYHLASGYSIASYQPQTLAQILECEPIANGIYSDYLQRLLTILLTHPELNQTLQQVLTQRLTHPTTPHIQKLQSLGLVEIQGERIQISCELHRRYFTNYGDLTQGFNLPQISPTPVSLEQFDQD